MSTTSSSDTAKAGISKKVFAATTIVILAVAAVGFGLYANQVLKPAPPVRIGVTGGFLSGSVVSFQFFQALSCAPAVDTLFANTNYATAASAAAKASVTCEGGAAGTFPSNVQPVWGMAPAFAGLSIFGATNFGATADGFPVWNNTGTLTAIHTHCTGMGSTHKCPNHPPLFFSPAIIAVEQYLNMPNGVMGLPLGVMPFPAHTHIVATDAGQQDIPWNAIAVFVFDPNIFPDPVSGTCTKVAPSNLTNPTGNCLNSTAALQAAMGTADNGIPTTNQSNPIWNGLGKPMVQVVVAGATSAADYAKANSNIDVPFAVIPGNPYPPYLG
jgi:hypothetical protein